MVARQASFSCENIKSGFCNTGLVSLDRNIIILKLQATNPKSQDRNLHSNNYCTPRNNSTVPDLQPLSTFSTHQINSILIPINKPEIEHQELITLSTLSNNDLMAWGLKRVVSNIAVSASRALTVIDEKEHQIQNLKKQLADTQQKKKINRSRIPISGEAWIDCDDIVKFFKSQTTKEHKTSERKYHNATNLVIMRKQKLADCTRKRKEVEKLEEEGRLPKHQKTGTALLQEERQLTQQIFEAEQKLEKLEKHLEDMRQNVSLNDGTYECGNLLEDQAESQFGQEDIPENLGEEVRASIIPTQFGNGVDFSISL
ncbi:hypothetical protein L873DRAFT_1903700 [Choiromyces venosus 120613-1]|uniref:Uncharacterized protein n=1 Tax=Choiromyces venosus 120613-1 TaxID=1336337 RepID=A0A3N4K1X3_9PEZI|nr:hypothetical protein L873DRAFT_1903700 [Choiromyces venosus 120613-1]